MLLHIPREIGKGKKKERKPSWEIPQSLTEVTLRTNLPTPHPTSPINTWPQWMLSGLNDLAITEARVERVGISQAPIRRVFGVTARLEDPGEEAPADHPAVCIFHMEALRSPGGGYSYHTIGGWHSFYNSF